jgi:hypothetical protein
MPGPLLPDYQQAALAALAASQPRTRNPAKTVPQVATIGGAPTAAAPVPADVFAAFRAGVDSFTVHLPKALGQATAAAAGFRAAVR